MSKAEMLRSLPSSRSNLPEMLSNLQQINQELQGLPQSIAAETARVLESLPQAVATETAVILEPLRLINQELQGLPSMISTRDIQGFGASNHDQPGIAGPAPTDIDRNSTGLGTIESDQGRIDELTAGSGGGGSSTALEPLRQINKELSNLTQIKKDIQKALTAYDTMTSAMRKTLETLTRAAASTDQPASGPDNGQLGEDLQLGEDRRRYGQEHQNGNVSGKDSGIEPAIVGTDGCKIPVLANNPDVSDQRDNRRVTGTDGLSRFRKASAAKRRGAAEQRNTPAISSKSGTQTKGNILQDFKQIDPTTYLENQGFTVKQEGRHLSAQINGDEIYRITEKSDDGRWIWCDRYNNQGGDNIDLVQEIEPGTKFTDAVYKLNGGQSLQESQQPRKEPVKRQPPILPHQGPIQRHYGREYLYSRGISKDTLDHAEKSGMLQFADGAVLFVGLDQDGKAQNVTRRAIDRQTPRKSVILKAVTRVLRRSCPVIRPGFGLSRVVPMRLLYVISPCAKGSSPPLSLSVVGPTSAAFLTIRKCRRS